MKFLGNILTSLILLLNIAAAALMILSAYSGNLFYRPFPIISLTPLAFHWILAANLLFIPVWIIVRRKMILVPLGTLLICSGPVLDFFPLHPFRHKTEADASKREIKILTYNTLSFGVADNQDMTLGNPVTKYLQASGADIICIQEPNTYYFNAVKGQDFLPEYQTKIYEQVNSTAIFSKYPVIDHRLYTFTEKGNSFLRCSLKAGQDTIVVYSCHLQSIGLSQQNIDDYHAFVGDPRNHETHNGSKEVLKKLLAATQDRGFQADSLCACIERETSKYIIVAGDFNDTPMSYAHLQVEKRLSDIYAKSGFGIGATYNKNGLNYRIDHIFASKSFKPIHCWTDKSTVASDHYPVVAILSMH